MCDGKRTFTSIFRQTMAEENWQTVQQQAEAHTPVLFPVGVIEEHGPHLPLGSDIYCFNYHGDDIHTGALVTAIQRANEELGISVKLVIEAMDAGRYGWSGEEDFLLVLDPAYPMAWFTQEDDAEAGLLDIHAGAFETAVIHYLCPELTDLEVAESLTSSALSEETLQLWLQGGEHTRSAVPLGYAGNPAGHEAVGAHVEDMLNLQAEDITAKITTNYTNN